MSEVSDTSSVIQEFRLSNLVDEFTEHSSAEIERLRSSQSEFDEALYQQAVELVIRKLNQRDPRDIR